MAKHKKPTMPIANALVSSEPASSVWSGWSESGRQAPVFVLSSFRTGSTWLWQKMRRAPTVIAYYEIFHEALSTVTPAQARQIDFSTWDSRHPASPPYFLEYLPLLESQGGIAGFDPSMVLEGSIPVGDLRPAEKAYVERLISATWAKRRIPVLSCTRSLGRARALRRAVGGRTIFLHRNLFHQWASYCWQAESGNPYFLETIRLMIGAAPNDSFLRGLSEWFDLRDPALPQEKLFQVFILLHLYLYSLAFDAADLVVDLTEIATDASVRLQVEQEISEMIRDEIDLSDVRKDCEFTGMTVASPQLMRDTIQQFAKLIPNASLSSQSIQFVERAKDQALAEWDRFEFFNRRTRVVLTGKAEVAAKLLDERAAETESLRSERDRLTLEIDTRRAALQAAESEKEASAQQLSQVEAERDAALKRAAEAAAESGALRAELAQATAVRDTALDKATEADAQSGTLRTELAKVTAIRDDLERSVAQAKSERDASLYHRARSLLARRD